jgi:hypothetical protein
MSAVVVRLKRCCCSRDRRRDSHGRARSVRGTAHAHAELRADRRRRAAHLRHRCDLRLGATARGEARGDGEMHVAMQARRQHYRLLDFPRRKGVRAVACHSGRLAARHAVAAMSAARARTSARTGLSLHAAQQVVRCNSESASQQALSVSCNSLRFARSDS